MIEFEPLKGYYRYNIAHEPTYKIFILSRKNTSKGTIIEYTVTKYTMDYGECEYDNNTVDRYTSYVYYESGTEVLYITDHKIVVSAHNTHTCVIKCKEYIHNLITNRHFLKEEVRNIEVYARSQSIKSVLLTLVLQCLNATIETAILDINNMDGIVMLVTIANSLMVDIETSDGILFHKSKVFITSPMTVVYISQLSKFILVDILYDFYKDIIATDTREIIENLIQTYLILQ